MEHHNLIADSCLTMLQASEKQLHKLSDLNKEVAELHKTISQLKQQLNTNAQDILALKTILNEIRQYVKPDLSDQHGIMDYIFGQE